MIYLKTDDPRLIMDPPTDVMDYAFASASKQALIPSSVTSKLSWKEVLCFPSYPV
jgi:hypothetical protein